jgi:hypothetical protein
MKILFRVMIMYVFAISLHADVSKNINENLKSNQAITYLTSWGLPSDYSAIKTSKADTYLLSFGQ